MPSPLTSCPQSAPSLPAEILFLILAYNPPDPASQPTIHAFTLVSRSWYTVGIPALYHTPFITGKNFDKFVSTICPSINQHVRKSELAELVRRLDMSHLVHSSSKSLTARLLNRVKNGLEVFVAPQASFAINCLAALSKCKKLQRLNLTLVSESLELSAICRSIHALDRLVSLHLPRSISYGVLKTDQKTLWPPQLKTIHISGHPRPDDWLKFQDLPHSLTNLTIDPVFITFPDFIYGLLPFIGPQLKYLKFAIPRSQDDTIGFDFNWLIRVIPNVRHLAMDFTCTSLVLLYGDYSAFPDHPLETLKLYCDDFQDIRDAGDLIYWLTDFVVDGPLKNLRRVGVSRSISQLDGFVRDKLEFLGEYLEALEREDEDNGTATGKPKAGVWTIED